MKKAAKPALMALGDFNSNKMKFESILLGNKDLSNTSRDLLTGYITYRVGLGASPNNALQNYNQVPLNAYTNGGDIFMNQLLQNGGW